MFVVKVFQGDLHIELQNNETFTLGRNHLKLNVVQVSRAQFEVTVDAHTKRVTLKNAGRNTCFLNDKDKAVAKGTSVELHDGDLISIPMANVAPLRVSITDTTVNRAKVDTAARSDDGESVRTDEDLALSDDSVDKFNPDNFSDESDFVWTKQPVKMVDRSSDTEEPKPVIKKRVLASASPSAKISKKVAPLKISGRSRTTQNDDSKESAPRPSGAPRSSTAPSSRRMTGYGAFSKRKRTSVKNGNKGASTSDVTKLLKELWSNMSQDERRVYEDEAAAHNLMIEEREEEDDEDEKDGGQNDEEKPWGSRTQQRSGAKFVRNGRKSDDGDGYEMDIDSKSDAESHLQRNGTSTRRQLEGIDEKNEEDTANAEDSDAPKSRRSRGVSARSLPTARMCTDRRAKRKVSSDASDDDMLPRKVFSTRARTGVIFESDDDEGNNHKETKPQAAEANDQMESQTPKSPDGALSPSLMAEFSFKNEENASRWESGSSVKREEDAKWEDNGSQQVSMKHDGTSSLSKAKAEGRPSTIAAALDDLFS
ncbi:hypothetical protein BJ742DRAFT_832228 [Cladochytrium replicatum]|nr:hypothetical protein BJ742DRAFT_832228 [Cladochytrium replicatum]